MVKRKSLNVVHALLNNLLVPSSQMFQSILAVDHVALIGLKVRVKISVWFSQRYGNKVYLDIAKIMFAITGLLKRNFRKIKNKNV